MSRKNIVFPIYISSTAASNTPLSQSLAASFFTISTNVNMDDVFNYQINVTTTNSTGVFTLQGSDDNVNFIDIGSAGVVAAANDSILCEFNQVSFNNVRLKYVSTIAGTGTCNIIFTAKSLGA